MIVPMKKYAFLIYHSDYKDFLNGLRELGVLHVRQRKIEPSEELVSSIQLQKDIREVLHALRQRATTAKDAPELSASEGLDIVTAFRELTEQLENLRQQLGALQKEINFLQPWGDFPVERLTQLQEAGILVRFFVCPQKKYRPAWEQRYPVKIINTAGPDTYFVVVTRKGEEPNLDAEEIPPPETSLSHLTARRDALKEQIGAIEEQLDRYAAIGQPALEAALRETEDTAQLIAVIESTQKEAEGSVMLLEGFAPITREEKLIEFCRSNEIPFLTEKPTPDDSPPILLKNSAFARLFEPIGELFSLPGYRELDLTPFFAPFFMMFFGFCLGDAGYGIVVLLGATLYKTRAETHRKPVLTLAQWLGVATIIFGALTGTFFGINLLEDQFAFLGDLRSFMLNSDQVFQLALALGMVQIIFGLFVKASNQVRQFGFQYAIATYGWVILILSLLDLAFLEWTGQVSTYTAWLGVALIMLFNDPKAGLFGRLGKGLWELYGITGIFGDLLSYIRLFALGISSAILGYVVNDIALQVKDGIPYLGPVLFVLFLLVGHGANLLIASLGAFVHPMRLTFVEFYKNAGFTGGGKPYQPLSSKNND